MKAKSVKEVLIAAKYLLKNVGWCQEYYAKKHDRDLWINSNSDLKDQFTSQEAKEIIGFCSIGAIRAVEATDVKTKLDAIEAIRSVIPPSYRTITSWNDFSDRTKEQVLAVFDRAIKSAEGK